MVSNNLDCFVQLYEGVEKSTNVQGGRERDVRSFVTVGLVAFVGIKRVEGEGGGGEGCTFQKRVLV